jgi:hypothetical protein
VRRSPDRQELLIAAGYLAAIALWIYAIPRGGGTVETVVVLAAVLVLHVLTGWGIGRWWALLLPVAAVLVAIPAGTPDVGYEPLPVWFGIAVFIAPPALVVVGLAVIARKAARRRRRRRQAGAH